MAQNTHHSDEYSVAERPKPRFEQYEAQTAGVIEDDEVEAEMSARPLVPSAMRLDEAEAKPAGSVPTELAAADDEAEAAAEPVAEAPALGVRSALYLDES